MVTQLPPRPIAPGDVVAVYSDALGEWTAAQITHVDAEDRMAAVLELDWSGPEPTSVADLGEVRPLRLTHHSWNGTLSHSWCEWTLLRSFKVIGTLPPLVTERPNSYSFDWERGEQLAHQRLWDSGSRETWTRPYASTCTSAELALDEPRPDIEHLSVSEISELDCDRLVESYPNLTRLTLRGSPGYLRAAAGLNRLAALRTISLTDLFDMSGPDTLLPQRTPELEQVWLHNIPADYASTMRKTWLAEAAQGVHVDITGARKPKWLAENLTNPLREWDGRKRIPGRLYRKALAQYQATRQAFLTAVTEGADSDGLFAIGEAFGEAFNKLDGAEDLIETVEREELYEALHCIVREAESALGTDLTTARNSLLDGVESTRDW